MRAEGEYVLTIPLNKAFRYLQTVYNIYSRSAVFNTVGDELPQRVVITRHY